VSHADLIADFGANVVQAAKRLCVVDPEDIVALRHYIDDCYRGEYADPETLALEHVIDCGVRNVVGHGLHERLDLANVRVIGLPLEQVLDLSGIVATLESEGWHFIGYGKTVLVFSPQKVESR